jgi:predicted nucleic acid-binding protein
LIVADASTLTDFLLGQTATLASVADALRGRESEALHVPELAEPEVLNALRRLALKGDISEHRAAEAVGDLGSARLVRYAHWPLRDRVWGLRDDLTAYDATYLALAEALDASLLMTADQGLAEVAARWLGAERVDLTG